MKIDGAKLKAMREKAKLTPFDLACAVGYRGAQRIYQLESDGGTVHDAIGHGLAKALKCKESEITQ